MAKWTKAQEAAIEGKGSKILVSAAAGSGKTSVMIERVARLICAGESIESMAICTFTKRAAADMKLKLTVKLKALAASNSSAAAALKGVAQADISTLHSWCSKLIKTYFYAVNVDPNFEIMPETAQKIELANAIERAISLELEQGEQDFTELYDILLSGRNHTALASLIKRIFSKAVALPYPMQYLDNSGKTLHDEQYYIDILEHEKALDDEPYASEEKTFRHIAVLTRLTKAVMQQYCRVKSKKAWLDYSDLEQQALRLLRSDYASLVKSKYKYIFIDEYQDINPLQEELLKIDTNMFYVGDVKQSIYGFRMCAPEFFMAKRADYIANGTGMALELNKNWRSDNKILQFVNKVFTRVMTDEFGKVDYAHSAAFEEGQNIYDNSVVAKFVALQKKESQEQEPKIYSVANHDFGADEYKAEQKLVLEHILQLIKTTITDSDGKTRLVSFSDIAILVRSRNNYTLNLMALLKSAGIDCSFTDATSIAEHKYIGYLISYLRLLDNSRDDISLASVMLQFGDFSNEELAQIRINASDNCFFFEAVQQCAYQTDSLGKKVSEFLQKVSGYRELASSENANYICQTLVSEYDYFKVVYANSGEDEAQSLAEMLDGLENSPYNANLYQYLQSIDVSSSDLVVREHADSVKVMTIHAAKGLEFKFVILPNLSKKFEMRDISQKMLLTDEGICLKYFNYFSHTTTTTARMAAEVVALKKRLLEEEMRIFYVALTRPIYQLALFASFAKTPECESPQTAKSYLDWLWDSARDDCEIIDEADCVADMTAPKQKIIFKKVNKQLVSKINERINFAPAQPHLPVKTNVSKILADTETDKKIVYTAGAQSDDKALLRGTAYHKVMELLDFDAPFEDEWRRILSVYPDTNLTNKSVISVAAAKVKQLIGGGKIYKEQPFVYSADSLIQGVIDLLIVYGDSAIIVDYKTTRASDLTKENYGKQLSLYSSAVKDILGVTVQKKLLYSFEKGDFVAV